MIPWTTRGFGYGQYNLINMTSWFLKTKDHFISFMLLTTQTQFFRSQVNDIFVFFKFRKHSITFWLLNKCSRFTPVLIAKWQVLECVSLGTILFNILNKSVDNFSRIGLDLIKMNLNLFALSRVSLFGEIHCYFADFFIRRAAFLFHNAKEL